MAMTAGTLELTRVSATISRDAGFNCEPIDTFATIRCSREQRSTKTARDQGRLPAWNESFTFVLEEDDLSKNILVQVFAVNSDLDELLGAAKIPIATAIEQAEGTLCSLNCPGKGEVGQLKASWRWTSAAKVNFSLAKPQMDLPQIPTNSSSGSFNPNQPLGAYDGPVSYPYSIPNNTNAWRENVSSDVADDMAKLGLGKEYSEGSIPSAPPYVEAGYSSRGEFYSSEGSYSSAGSAYHRQSYGADHFTGMNTASGYPNTNIMIPGEKNDIGKEAGFYTSSLNPPPGHSFQYNYPPFGQTETPAYVSRGSGKIKDKDKPEKDKSEKDKQQKDKRHESQMSNNYPPPVHGGFPPTHLTGYHPPPPSGYPPAHPPPPTYGHPPQSYPSLGYLHAPAYPPAPQGPAPHAYPTVPAPQGPASHGYPTVPAPQGSAPHGYPQGPAPHGYPAGPAPHGYPPGPQQHAAPAYPPYGYSPPVYASQSQSSDSRFPGQDLVSSLYEYVPGFTKQEKQEKQDKHDKKDKDGKKDKDDKKDKKDKDDKKYKDKHDKHDKNDKHDKKDKDKKHKSKK